MARRIPDDRFDQLIDVATQVFIEQGYRRTQMADVAEAMGVAKGTLYLYVESKEALFDLACRWADGPRPVPRPEALPVPTPAPGSTVAYVANRLAREGQLTVFATALAARRVRDVDGELAGIVGELYDTLARNRRSLKLIDRSARSMPDLAALWFTGARGEFLKQLVQYLEDRLRRRLFRPVPDVATAARLILETIVFWAVHRHWDAHPDAIDDATAKATVIRFVVGALAQEDAR
jgi:AcrR family transcriptional regulator